MKEDLDELLIRPVARHDMLSDEFNGDPQYALDRNVEALCRDLNCEVIYSTPKTLLLDFDNEADYKDLGRKLYLINEVGSGQRLTITEEWRSRNNNWHVIVTSDCDMTLHERGHLQALLGSDLIREIYNLARIDRELEPEITLFKPIR